MIDKSLPTGFERRASGILAPGDGSKDTEIGAEVGRERQTWTKDEGRTISRANKLSKARGMTLALRCDDPRCATTPIEMIRHNDGAFTLRCPHLDRYFAKGY